MDEDWQEVPSRNHRRSNVDDVSKVAKSVFVTNFLESVSARDLWKSCTVYGTVVDVFIPSKKSKARKRFAFVRFIKVFILDSLGENMCTIWIGRYYLYVNSVRFERSLMSFLAPTANAVEFPKKSFVPHDDDGVPETVFGPNTSSPNQVDRGNENSKSEDPFGIYDMLAHKKDNVTSESRPSLSHPSGFTPEGVVHHE
nr:RNA-directed DNA polymerase, eukaryota, nucleotide-binding alpha-beta plait domain protein [Tanacetum cinerariifolium]